MFLPFSRLLFWLDPPPWFLIFIILVSEELKLVVVYSIFYFPSLLGVISRFIDPLTRLPPLLLSLS